MREAHPGLEFGHQIERRDCQRPANGKGTFAARYEEPPDVCLGDNLRSRLGNRAQSHAAIGARGADHE